MGNITLYLGVPKRGGMKKLHHRPRHPTLGRHQKNYITHAALRSPEWGGITWAQLYAVLGSPNGEESKTASPATWGPQMGVPKWGGIKWAT